MYNNPYFNNNLFEPQFMQSLNFNSNNSMKPYFSIYDQMYIPVRKEHTNININKDMLNLNNLIRRLWVEHAIWTKLAITGIINDTQDKKFTAKRLLQNPEDFEKLFANYFGLTVAKKFSELLKDHLLIAADLVTAIMKEDSKSITMLDKKWYDNAKEIAEFLSSINQHWDKKEMEQMMFKHLDLVKSEVMSIINNKYEDSIKIFDEIQNQALKMADTYTEGFVKKFPNKFM